MYQRCWMNKALEKYCFYFLRRQGFQSASMKASTCNHVDPCWGSSLKHWSRWAWSIPLSQPDGSWCFTVRDLLKCLLSLQISPESWRTSSSAERNKVRIWTSNLHITWTSAEKSNSVIDKRKCLSRDLIIKVTFMLMVKLFV